METITKFNIIFFYTIIHFIFNTQIRKNAQLCKNNSFISTTIASLLTGLTYLTLKIYFKIPFTLKIQFIPQLFLISILQFVSYKLILKHSSYLPATSSLILFELPSILIFVLIQKCFHILNYSVLKISGFFVMILAFIFTFLFKNMNIKSKTNFNDFLYLIFSGFCNGTAVYLIAYSLKDLKIDFYSFMITLKFIGTLIGGLLYFIFEFNRIILSKKVLFISFLQFTDIFRNSLLVFLGKTQKNVCFLSVHLIFDLIVDFYLNFKVTEQGVITYLVFLIGWSFVWFDFENLFK